MEKDFLPLTADPGDLGHYLFDQVPILRKLCEVLGSSDKPLEQTKASFPILGYPYPLIRAHENANLSGLEMSLLKDLLTKAISDLVDNKDRERLLRHIKLGQRILKGGMRHGT